MLCATSVVSQTKTTLLLLFECSSSAEPMCRHSHSLLLQKGAAGHPVVTLPAYNVMYNLDIPGLPRAALLQEGAAGHQGVTLHVYNVMYNLDIQGLSRACGDHTLIQEKKRNMVYRR